MQPDPDHSAEPEARASLNDRNERIAALDIAARSVLESQVLGVTVASLVAERALEHHWEGLHQYAALRVGASRASDLLEQLAHALDEEPRDTLEALPGPRARLYKRMRELIAGLRGAAVPAERAALFWPRDVQLAARVGELRRTLAPASAELLELQFARGLSTAEVAWVTDQDLASVEQQSAALFARAERLFGRRPPSRDRTVEGALLEAFALDPSKRAPRRRSRRPVLEPGAVIADRYEIEAKLGSGAFAEVYRARDRDVVDRVVALKILRRPAGDERSVQSALRELQLIASVFHPSVVALKDHGWHGGRLWLVMPLYRGETLAERLARGPVGRSEARAIFEPLAEALATMHRAGVLHQDIKPENVFLATLDPQDSRDGDGAGSAAGDRPARILPVLLDLGVAAKDAELVLAGTPAYFAPEMAARFAGAPDPALVGPKADVFSLALTLRQALDPAPIERAVAGSVDAFVAYRAAHAPPPPAARELRDLRPHFERWLHFSPDRRPSAEALRTELAALTRKQEQREQRLTFLSWALPMLVTVLALFGTTTYVLSREAAIQRLQAANARVRAEQARERVADITQSLTAQQARRRELEADVARLERDYQNSKMTREQLVSRLAQAEGELEVQRSALAQRTQKQVDDARSAREQRALLSAELQAALASKDDLATKLERTSNQLELERARAAAIDPLREQLKAARAELDAARDRERETQTQIAMLRQALLPPASTASRAHANK